MENERDSHPGLDQEGVAAGDRQFEWVAGGFNCTPPTPNATLCIPSPQPHLSSCHE